MSRGVGEREMIPREPRLRNIISAPQSTAATAAGSHAAFICGGFSG